MELNVNVRVPAVEKLIDYTASGLGSVAGPILAPGRAWLEGKALEIEAKSTGRALITHSEAMAQAQAYIQSPETAVQGELDFSQRAEMRFRYQVEKQQRNIEDIVHSAAENLDGKEVPDAEPDHDWTSRFFVDAQDVSSSRMKELYGKVLSGQIERPGSFSLMSLSVLRNMDQRTARRFQTLCSACITLMPGGQAIMDCRVPVLTGDAGNNALRNYGLSFDQLNVLNEHGLIISDYNSWFPFSMNFVRIEGGKKTVPVPFRFLGQFWGLEVIDDSREEPGADFKIAGVALTQVGRELSTIVEIEPMDQFAEDFKSALRERNLRLMPVEILPLRLSQIQTVHDRSGLMAA